MNRERDFDQTLRHWLDDGAEQAPERFVWAALEDVERAAQRGAWRALLEALLMHLKPAAPVLGVAAVVVLAIAAYQMLGGNVGAPREPTATPTPAPRILTSDDAMGLWDLAMVDGMEVDETTSGYAALTTPLRPGGEIISLTGFVDAHMQNFGTTDTGGYVVWSALYETLEQSEAAFDFLVTEHESPEGWGLEPSSARPALGDEAVSYSGPAYEWEAATIYLWRVNNLLVASVGVGDADPTRVRTIADIVDQLIDDRVLNR